MTGETHGGSETDQDHAGSFARRATDWLTDNRGHWVRALLMVLFFIVLSIIRVVVGLIALFQVISLFLTGQANDPLRSFGTSLARYTADLIAYLTCADDQLPFPFSPWPGRDADGFSR